MSSETILVIDDSTEMITHLTEYILPTFGYETISAMDGESGLSLIRNQHPDLIMLDYNLPRMTGIDVLQQMAQESLNTPVILMTGYGSELSAIEAFRLGAKDYLIKPFTMDEVVDAISRALVEMRLLHDKEALAEESRRLRVELDRQAQEMRTLFNIGKAVTSLLSVRKIMKLVMEAVVKLTGGEHCVMWIPDGNDGAVRAYISDENGEPALYQKHTSIAGMLVEEVMNSGKPIRRSEFSGDGLHLFGDYRARAVLCIPLKLGGEALGALSVVNTTIIRRFSRRHEFLLSFLSDYTAIALKNARIMHTVDNALSIEVDKLNTLIEVTHAITSTVNLDEIAQLTINQVHTHWNLEASSIWLVDEQAGELSVLASVGTAVEELANVRIPIGAGFVGRVIETGKPIISNNVVEDIRHHHAVDDITGFQTYSLVCVPLIAHGKTVGAMQLVNNLNSKFNEHDVEWATSIATAVAIAVSNALSVPPQE